VSALLFIPNGSPPSPAQFGNPLLLHIRFPSFLFCRIQHSTVFTAPASCSTSWTYEASTYNGITSGILLQNAVAVLLDTECFPPGFEQAGRIFLDQIFSPGACPQGYVTQSPLLVNSGTSTATCCSQYVLHQSQTA